VERDPQGVIRELSANELEQRHGGRSHDQELRWPERRFS
jgi:hypothetical protein